MHPIDRGGKANFYKCSAAKTPFVPKQVLKAIDNIEKLCRKSETPSGRDSPSFQSKTDFGVTVEISRDGNTLAIGADFYDVEDSNGVEQTNAGAVFVFSRKVSFSACGSANQNSDKKYKLQQILVATDPKTGEQQPQSHAGFGITLSMSGNGSRIAVGSQLENLDGTPDVGAVYIFNRKPKSWVHYDAIQKLTPEKPFEDKIFFGTQVALSKNGLVLTVRQPLSARESTIFFYEDCLSEFSSTSLRQTPRATLFELKQRINVEDVVDGTSVLAQNVATLGFRMNLSESGSTAVITAPHSSVVVDSGEKIERAGMVFVVQRCFDRRYRSGVTDWFTTQVLTSKIPQRSALFGYSVALTPNAQFVAVKEPYRSEPPAGSSVSEFSDVVSVFEQQCDSATYNLAAQLRPVELDTQPSRTLFQKSVAITSDGCTIAVGYDNSTVSGKISAGAVVIYQRTRGSIQWKQTQVLTAFPSIEDDQSFGTGLTVSGDGNDVVVGAWVDNPNDFAYTFSSRFL